MEETARFTRDRTLGWGGGCRQPLIFRFEASAIGHCANTFKSGLKLSILTNSHNAVISSSLAGGLHSLGIIVMGFDASTSGTNDGIVGLNTSRQNASRSSKPDIDELGRGSDTTCLRGTPGSVLGRFRILSIPASERRRLRVDGNGGGDSDIDFFKS